MLKKILLLTVIPFFVVGFLISRLWFSTIGGAPPYMIEDLEPPSADEYVWLRDWKRPEGPASVGLQVGHWKNEELPDELERLRGSTGSAGGGKSEWEVNLSIAEATAEILENHGVDVEILPATIPPKFWADAFIAIHADGSTDPAKSGYKVASPRRDFSGKAASLVSSIESTYENQTGLIRDPNVTPNMRGYYAFAWWRYDHAVHPMSASAIVETGFLTNPSDRRLIVNNPQAAAQGLAEGILDFLESESLLDQEAEQTER